MLNQASPARLTGKQQGEMNDTMTQIKHARGGARKNTGLVQSVEAQKEVWQLLRTVLLARYGKADKATVNAWFAGTVRREWAEYDAMIQQLAENVYDNSF